MLSLSPKSLFKSQLSYEIGPRIPYRRNYFHTGYAVSFLMQRSYRRVKDALFNSKLAIY